MDKNRRKWTKMDKNRRKWTKIALICDHNIDPFYRSSQEDQEGHEAGRPLQGVLRFHKLTRMVFLRRKHKV
jgi:hypothetical protein